MKYLSKFEKELSEKRRLASFLTSGVILKSGLSEGRKKGRGRIIYAAEPTNRIVDDADEISPSNFFRSNFYRIKFQAFDV